MSKLSKLKRVDAETIVKALVKIGFQPIRQHGSHLVMKHPDGRLIVVPIHRGRRTWKRHFEKNSLRDDQDKVDSRSRARERPREARNSALSGAAQIGTIICRY